MLYQMSSSTSIELDFHEGVQDARQIRLTTKLPLSKSKWSSRPNVEDLGNERVDEPEGKGSGQRDVENVDRFSTMGLRAAMMLWKKDPV